MLSLRHLQRAGWLPTLARAASSSAPSVYDKLIQFTIVDKLGRRHVVRGLEGQSIVDVIAAHSEQLGEDVLCLSPDGRDKWDVHIKVPVELLDRVPLSDRDDVIALEQVADPKSLNEHSRLGSKVILSKDLNGTLIAIADNYFWKTL
eukprot:scaffold4.g4617.t1